MAVNNSWTGYEMWARVFQFSKSTHCYNTEPTQNFIFMLSFDNDKEGNDQFQGLPL